MRNFLFWSKFFLSFFLRQIDLKQALCQNTSWPILTSEEELSPQDCSLSWREFSLKMNGSDKSNGKPSSIVSTCISCVVFINLIPEHILNYRRLKAITVDIDICLCLSQASKLYKEARSQGACSPPHTHTPHSPFFLAGNIFLKFTYEKLNYNRVGSLIFFGMHYVKENEMKLRVKLKL